MKSVLKHNYEFRRAYYKGKSAPGSKVAVYVVPNRLGVNRLGLTVSKKKFKKAIHRNRCKRLMREAFYSLAPQLKSGLDFVIAARSACVFATMPQVKADMLCIFEKLKVLDEETPH